MRFIANRVSAKIERKLFSGEIQELYKLIRSWAQNYVNQIEDQYDEDGLQHIQKDVAARYRKILQARMQRPVAVIDTHEMMKRQIREENIEVHEASGVADLKYKDEYCATSSGEPTGKFGGRSGRDVGIFGEEPTIVRQGGVLTTLESAQSNIASAYDDDDQSDRASVVTGEGSDTEPTTTNINVNNQKATAMGTELKTYFTHQEELEDRRAREEQARDDRAQELMIELNVMTEDIKLHLEEIKKVTDYFLRKEKAAEEKPSELDPEKVYFRDAYLHFDTRSRDLTYTQEENVGKWKWSVSNIPFIAVEGGVGVVFALQDIVEMEIETFDIPADNLFPNFYNRVSLFIEEINTQAVMSSENTRYHWMFHTETVGGRIQLTPTRRKMTFKDPIKFLTDATFTFRWPYQLVPFNKDRLPATATPGSNPALWTTDEPHSLSTNDPVYFVGVDTGNPEVNTLLNTVDGIQITKINATQFTIPIDFTTVAIAVSAVPYFGSKRIIIPIRFRCLSRGKETNFMMATGEHFG